ncbi:lytic polysaccharide monooxygenase auxiliary activity family 9 protein [Fluviispira multicolorata]|uniref:Chitin-binding type-4 domain-containing protein n=1 Tax=Fluviispira multicolorata TaxID=2654512 RepID=A0A833N7S2_9BACT|nr:lytic polysaccharide monooxygenase [Fluviispira multicolorata]KAB8033281.1 hypothetical protein GCL57_00875 [Fluviispira multicolorata]
MSNIFGISVDFYRYTSLGIFLLPIYSYAHGTIETPISRVYSCYKEDPEDLKSAACQAVVDASSTDPLYNWNGINQLNAAGNHKRVVPDGHLCGGGNEMFIALDLNRFDWNTTIIKSTKGKFNFVYLAAVPHATKYFKFYITKDSYDYSHPLKWSDLEDNPFCTINKVTLSNDKYNMACDFPLNKKGKHVIYNIWQRSDSPEAFYSCSDVYIE